jgi:ABC-type bacteriocin/lantibiotic exporter with double-glycine peptidase domain
MTLGDLLAAGMLADVVGASLGRLGRALLPLAAASAQAARVDSVLTPVPSNERRSRVAYPSVPETGRRPAAAAAIELDDASFRYAPDEPWIAERLSLSVAAGAVYRLRGASGSGKTTILRMMAGLIAPTRGRVTVLGQSPAALRDQILYVPQEVALFEGSILSNLTLLSGADKATVLAAAHQTGLADVWSTLPLGPDAIVFPRGANLSAGQRQLVVLTAALASSRKVLLLDEPLAHLDRPTRHRVLASPLFRDRTVVLVSHED